MMSLRQEYASYRRANRVLLAAAGIYILIALTRHSVPQREEIFPFASWSLFSKVPNEIHDYGLRVLEMDGRVMNPPIDYEASYPRFTSSDPHMARACIQQLGQAVKSRDAAEVARVRTYLESLHLRGHKQVKYELLDRRWDPLERWNEKKFRSLKVMATFQSGQGDS